MKIILLIFSIITTFSINLIAQSCAEVRTYTGVPTLFIDDKPYPPYAYMSYLGEKKYYEEIAKSNIHLYNIPAYLGDRGINSASGIGPFRPSIWVGKDEYDFSSLIKDFDELIEADPHSKVIVRFHLDPPSWWEELNPNHVSMQPDGSSFRHSFSSMKWREEAGKALKNSIEWLLESPYAEHLIGIHVAAGYTEEWFYHFRNYFYDENPIRTNAFRNWLRKEYNDDRIALQNAWNNRNVTFNNAELADISGKERKEKWRDSKLDQNYIDTFRFHTEIIVDHIIYFSKIVKETSNNCLLTGAFYGYNYFVTDSRRGHGALTKLLEFPGLDYLSSPNVYNREIGEDWAPMTAIQSVHLHGKLWLAENDTRTSVTTLLKDRAPEINPDGGWYDDGVWLGPKDIETSVALLWKNAARMLTNGYGGWWFDMWGGWFSDPELLHVLKKIQTFFSAFPPEKEDRMDVQVGVFLDEEIGFWDASYGRLSEEILSNRYSLGKTGTPYDLYLRSDITSIITSDYKVIWFLGIMELNDKEKILLDEWREKGKMVIWTGRDGTKIYHGKADVNHFPDRFQWDSSMLREIWKEAGVHIYLNTDDIFYIGRRWASIHSVKGGEKTLEFPFYAKIVDPLTQDVLSDSTNIFELVIDPISTKLLRVYPL